MYAPAPPPPPRVEVRPVAIDYGGAASELGWYDEPGKKNVLRILGRRRTVPVTIRILDPLEPMDDRKALAIAARARVEAALSSSPRHPRV
jgi:1-acyl-sn-glycerol-3-phosphate acyltransferase